ncbi:GNAT family N-acetyltransferase [Paramagnetospirillum marisnigri]|uniref:GNAT family N-acetyltransferase n=1 Tax=Paramagnetospirillum marisnigri TaxID=1285242 RepID=UPI000A4F0AC4|nr:GNAT family N-acetyltransferase [Paramagnetospirillum marisnigri]
MTPPAVIRPAIPDDAAVIVGLITRLAAFERAPTAVTLSEAAVRRDAFGPHRRFRVLLAEADGAACGIVTLLDTYSSWAGAPAMTVHDLFVMEAARGQGLARRLLAEAARLALAEGCARLDVNVLAWNESARRFYSSVGFASLADWLPYRLDAEGLTALADNR